MKLSSRYLYTMANKALHKIVIYYSFISINRNCYLHLFQHLSFHCKRSLKILKGRQSVSVFIALFISLSQSHVQLLKLHQIPWGLLRKARKFMKKSVIGYQIFLCRYFHRVMVYDENKYFVVQRESDQSLQNNKNNTLRERMKRSILKCCGYCIF